ncbi:hypothetical protein HanIR_Chr06g0281291 [Helianthus annuus]|nr:hypothetical protein HanIR_Chr06g0281291 [Helianthus annuus]
MNYYLIFTSKHHLINHVNFKRYMKGTRYCKDSRHVLVVMFYCQLYDHHAHDPSDPVTCLEHVKRP